MEGEEAAYWVKKDEEENGITGRPRRRAGNAIKAGIVEEEFTDNSENEEDSAQPTVGQMASDRYLLTCYTIWRRLWLQGCNRLWQKISDELPLRRYSKWDKGLWRLMTVVWPDEWVPMPCAEDELNTVAEIQAAGLDWSNDPEFAFLARGLVNEFLYGQPTNEFIKLVDRLDKHFGGFYTSGF